MKFTSKTAAANGTNRVSALKRLSKPAPINNNKSSIQNRLSAPTTPLITDARQLLSNRNKPVFDARQLLSRQSSKTINPSLTIRNDIVQMEEEEEEDDDDNQGPVFITRLADGRLTSGNSDRPFDKKKNTFSTIRNSSPTEPVFFTKTIANTTFNLKDNDDHHPKTQPSSSDEKVVISFVNDQYRKRPISPSPPPIIRRLHDASIQTAHHASAASRSPVRTNPHRRYLEEYDDPYEPPTKRNTSSRNTTTDKEQHTLPKASLKRTSTGAPISTRPSNVDASTVLITNLHSSVTEDDVIELFSEVGHIIDIKTLSRGCVQIIYSKEEHAEQAVDKFHNRLLDGQLMYVSLQQPTSYSTKSSKVSSSSSSSQYAKSTTTKNNSSSSSNNNESSKSNPTKMTLDPSFIRQALFNPSNNTKNPVQFQVKL